MIHYCVLLSLVFLLSPNGYAAPLSISSLDWSASAHPSVLEIGFDKSSVARFIEAVTDNDYLEAGIGDFKWVDLDGDKVYELIASVDYSGRAFFNNLYVIKQKGSKYHHQEVSVHNLETLDGAIVDLDGDGTSELILPILLSDYNGARPMAVWTAVYNNASDIFLSKRD